MANQETRSALAADIVKTVGNSLAAARERLTAAHDQEPEEVERLANCVKYEEAAYKAAVLYANAEKTDTPGDWLLTAQAEATAKVLARWYASNPELYERWHELREAAADLRADPPKKEGAIWGNDKQMGVQADDND